MSTASYLEAIDVSKSYPGVQALNRIRFDVREGECHALVGENGAGKSTLMKILAGAEPMDSGTIRIQGREVKIKSPLHAKALGISVIYQEFNLVPQLGAAENIFLGREPHWCGFVDFRKEREEARSLLARLGLTLDVNRPVCEFSVAQQQMVEIAKALSQNAKIIAMDEPSATLTLHELENLFALIRSLKKEGMAIIFISHRLDEIFEICDRVTVFRDGTWIDTRDVASLNRDDIIEMMVGRKLTEEFPKQTVTRGNEVLRVENITGQGVHNVSFSVHAGEIVAMTGLVGAGRTEVARMIFGADFREAGKVWIEGQPVSVHSPKDAIQAGIALLTEDRKSQGLILEMRVRENITLVRLGDFSRFLFIDRNREREIAMESMRNLQIKAPTAEVVVKNLSGGNQQKVVLAKWLLSKAKIVIFDEPTRGIDVGAKREIYLLMNHLLEMGAGILMISSELPEVLGMGDRILVMSEGYLVGELSREEATQEKIMHLATLSIRNKAASYPPSNSSEAA